MAFVTLIALIPPPLWTGANLAVTNSLATQQYAPAGPYRAIAAWLGRSTPEDSSVGYLEVGYIGYYSHRQMIDPLGLVTPGTTKHIREGDISWVLRETLPSYILVNPPFNPLLGPFYQEPWFQACYKKIDTIEGIDIYQRCPVVAAIDKVVLEQAQAKNNQPAGELVPQHIIGQTFMAKQDNLRSIGLLLATYGKKLQGPLTLHLQYGADAGKGPDIATMTVDMSELEDNSWKIFSFPPIANSAGKQFYAYLEAPQATAGQTITAWSLSDDHYTNGTLMINHAPASGDLALKLYYVKP
jgi:hypothetical protein